MSNLLKKKKTLSNPRKGDQDQDHSVKRRKLLHYLEISLSTKGMIINLIQNNYRIS